MWKNDGSCSASGDDSSLVDCASSKSSVRVHMRVVRERRFSDKTREDRNQRMQWMFSCDLRSLFLSVLLQRTTTVCALLLHFGSHVREPCKAQIVSVLLQAVSTRNDDPFAGLQEIQCEREVFFSHFICI